MTKHGLTIEKRLLDKISYDDDGCWRSAQYEGHNYGRIRVGNKMEWIHRVAYETWVGPIPDGYDVGHKCHDAAAAAGTCLVWEDCTHRACINPDHLKAEPRGANLLASPLTQASINSSKTECKRGHEFNEENTGYKKGTNWRYCRPCNKMTKAERDKWDREHACG